MATIITDDCISCGACEPECPNEAISEGDEYFVINPDLCTECVGFYGNEACQQVCPTEACVPDEDRRESEDTLFARAKALHADKEFGELDAETSRFRNPDAINPIS
ncbi:YfhL family 4Fe-4S dicluster ferredoxin [Myxococcota bacterium]|nr:YfhL family 4Fe-4S dicluster ferredoxin [Myxococcota bacterium]MBU1431635.1 YfhL family 4Fe-4S dicluster ferredoxin [Myxococcota bacterium]MBU1896787.1 YfhL family 4Fe-4S dicluster ferredoxin [Myxococcota bacterium]